MPKLESHLESLPALFHPDYGDIGESEQQRVNASEDIAGRYALDLRTGLLNERHPARSLTKHFWAVLWRRPPRAWSVFFSFWHFCSGFTSQDFAWTGLFSVREVV